MQGEDYVQDISPGSLSDAGQHTPQGHLSELDSVEAKRLENPSGGSRNSTPVLDTGDSGVVRETHKLQLGLKTCLRRKRCVSCNELERSHKHLVLCTLLTLEIITENVCVFEAWGKPHG